eukprot:TRINITY_DN36282_c0_g1_i1.p1 TRINITY_DN36282_c0_g1~~TRINITY_DN36282_c0_g1_i1.p1  ORF type:complete len:120 (+),score=11.34 TRINITY_DN36282_c0_g1_i1:677-1036(+)
MRSRTSFANDLLLNHGDINVNVVDNAGWTVRHCLAENLGCPRGKMSIADIHVGDSNKYRVVDVEYDDDNEVLESSPLSSINKKALGTRLLAVNGCSSTVAFKHDLFHGISQKVIFLRIK